MTVLSGSETSKWSSNKLGVTRPIRQRTISLISVQHAGSGLMAEQIVF